MPPQTRPWSARAYSRRLSVPLTGRDHTRPPPARAPRSIPRVSCGTCVLLLASAPASLLDAEHVLSLPDKPHGSTLRGKHLHGRCVQVLLRDDQLGAGVECHDVARVRPEVHDVADGAIGPDLAVGHRRTGLGDADLLR